MRPRFLPLALLSLLVALTRPLHAQDRGGFTFLTTLGYGLQTNGEVEVVESYGSGAVRSYGGGTQQGYAGLNLGVGGFVSKSTALMLRLSGTSVPTDYINRSGSPDEGDIVSGVVAVSVQHWASDRFNIEGGAGYGLLGLEEEHSFGLGLMIGGAYSFLQRGKISLQLGIEDALYHDHKRTVNSLGFCLGFQLL